MYDAPVYCPSGECNNTHGALHDTFVCHRCFMDATGRCDICDEVYSRGDDLIATYGSFTLCIYCHDELSDDDDD